MQYRLPALLGHVGATASTVHLCLALSRDGDDYRWIARSLIVAVFPDGWLDRPGDQFADYTPPRFVRDFPGRAFFLAGPVPTQIVLDWFAHPEDCALGGFDRRPSYGSRVQDFRLPELHETVSGMRFNSWQPTSFGALPWPHDDYHCHVKDANLLRSDDQEPLFAPGQGHFRDFREARKRLIYGLSDQDRTYYQDQDEVAFRLVDGDGWIREVRTSGTRLDVAVGGLRLSPGFVLLQGNGVEEERPCHGPGVVTFALRSDPSGPLDIILANDSGPLDNARYVAYPSPITGTSSAHVKVERDAEEGQAEEKARPASADAPAPTRRAGATRKRSRRAEGDAAMVVPMAIVGGTRDYIEIVTRQVNETYRAECYDACAVMIRRLVETLIIEVYEAHGIADQIQDPATNGYVPLKKLIDKVKAESAWVLGRNVKTALSDLKDVGDWSAHGRRLYALREDIDRLRPHVRVVAQELVSLMKQPYATRPHRAKTGGAREG